MTMKKAIAKRLDLGGLSSYETLREKSNQGEPTALDYYGASEPAEFFAVLTETFFEKPRQLKAKHPELYEEVRAYYRLDPIEWGE